MSCNSCSTKDGVPKGCKSNGSCGTGSCDKLTVFDWLSNMELPTGQKPYNIVEVRFKNGRKHFFKNEKNFHLTIGEVVAVEGNPGHDIGTVSLTGELVKIQMRKKNVDPDSDLVKKIYRKATEKDIKIWEEARAREIDTQKRGREIIIKLGLQMKLSDVEYQGDGNKATFYYTADERVDFRQLIRDLASAFSIRVEMKQVGLRQEAARLGGVGSCGRELCCSTWLTDFRKVNTAAARYQQLSLNPLKLAGQCGKLKCCLNYELDTYLDSLKSFPSQNTILKTEKGLGIFVKMDIFKEVLWYTYKEDKSKWFKLTLEQVQEIIEENKKGNTVESLEDFDAENIEETKVDFENVVGQDSLTRFDEVKKPKRRRNRKSNRNRNNNTNKTTEDSAVNRTADKNNVSPKPNNRPSRKPNNNRGRKPKSPNQQNNQQNNQQKQSTTKNTAEGTGANKATGTNRRTPNKPNNRPRPQNKTVKNRPQGERTNTQQPRNEKNQSNKPQKRNTNRRKPNPNQQPKNGPAKS